MSTVKRWYAVYTRPKWEKKVAGLLEGKGIENYCPLNRISRQWSDRKKIIYEPLFTSYVFVHVTENQHLPVKQTEGILNLVHWLGKPAVIPDAEIEEIKRFLNEHANVRLESAQVHVNDSVRIKEGPFRMYEGRVVEVSNRHIKVLLPSLNYYMVADLQAIQLDVLPRRQTPLPTISSSGHSA